MSISCVYLAGFFDGEGSLNISSTVNRGDSENRSYHLKVRLSQVISPASDELFDHIVSKYGGSLYFKNNNKRNSLHRNAVEWVVASRKAEIFLKDIFPYLLIKKEQVSIALEFQARRLPPGTRGESVGLDKHKRMELDLIDKTAIQLLGKGAGKLNSGKVGSAKKK